MPETGGRLLVALILFPLSATAFSRGEPDVFRGNRAFSDDQLLQTVAGRVPDFSLFSLYRPEVVERAAHALEDFYRGQGFFLVKVAGEEHGKTAVFDVAEGPETSLKSIRFTGNRFFSGEQILEGADLEMQVDSGDLESGLEAIRQAYRDEGFLRVQAGPVRVQVVEVEKSDHFPLPFRRCTKREARLIIPITEGARYTYGRIQIPEEISGPEFSPPATGRLYREKELVAFRQGLEAHFRRQGELLRRLDIYQNIRDDSRQVDLLVRYQLLPDLLIGRIEFVGNHRYPDMFYRRELKLNEQQLFDFKKLEESLKQLEDTGVVTSHELEFKVRDAVSEVDLIFHLKEKDRQRVNYSFGSDGLGGAESSFVYSIFNLLGLGEELGLDVSLGSQGTGLATSLASRYLLGTALPMSMVLRFFRRHTDLDLPDVEEPFRNLFQVDRVGASVGTRYRISPEQQAGLRVTGERVSTSVTSANWIFEPFWTRSAARDGRPVERVQVIQRFSLFQGPLDSWNMRPTVDYRRYFPGTTPQSPLFAWRIRASHARFFGGSAPITERLFGEGQQIRGFHTVSAGPWARFGQAISPVGGDTLFTVNSEYRMPVNRTFSVVPFFDTGFNMALTRPEGYELLAATERVWRASLGSELRIHPPGGLPTARLLFSWNPLRLDRDILTPRGLARLRDPAGGIRLALGPSF